MSLITGSGSVMERGPGCPRTQECGTGAAVDGHSGQTEVRHFLIACSTQNVTDELLIVA